MAACTVRAVCIVPSASSQWWVMTQAGLPSTVSCATSKLDSTARLTPVPGPPCMYTR